MGFWTPVEIDSKFERKHDVQLRQVDWNEDMGVYRAAYLEFRFPDGYNPWDDEIIPGETIKFDTRELGSGRIDHDKRGPGMSANGQALVIPLERPHEDCSQETCLGPLV